MTYDTQVNAMMSVLTDTIKDLALLGNNELMYSPTIINRESYKDVNSIDYKVIQKVLDNLNKLGYSTNIETQDDVNYLVISWRT